MIEAILFGLTGVAIILLGISISRLEKKLKKINHRR